MIAMLTDVHLRAEGSRRLPVGDDAPLDRSTRFADLLSAGEAGGVRPGVALEQANSREASPAVSSAVTTELDVASPTAEARMFNQYGFFASQAVVVPVLSPAGTTNQPDPIAVAMRDAGQAGSMPPSLPGQHDTALPKIGPVAIPAKADATKAHSLGEPRPLSVNPMGTSQARTVRTVTSPPIDGAYRARATPPRRTVPQGASVAVAVQAAADGMEVAAQIAGLDERERVRLADEIAAMLSMHGYVPAQVSITAVAARAARQEHR